MTHKHDWFPARELKLSLLDRQRAIDAYLRLVMNNASLLGLSGVLLPFGRVPQHKHDWTTGQRTVVFRRYLPRGEMRDEFRGIGL